MALRASRRYHFLPSLIAFLGLWTCISRHEAHADNPPKDPKAATSSKAQSQKLIRSSILPLLADSLALKDKIVKARGIIVTLDKDTDDFRSKHSDLSRSLAPIQSGLSSRPLVRDAYGGGMLPRLEYIERNLVKSAAEWERLSSAGVTDERKLRQAAVGIQKRFSDASAKAKQAKNQAAFTRTTGDRIIRDVMSKLLARGDKVRVAELDEYGRKLRNSIDEVERILGGKAKFRPSPSGTIPDASPTLSLSAKKGSSIGSTGKAAEKTPPLATRVSGFDNKGESPVAVTASTKSESSSSNARPPEGGKKSASQSGTSPSAVPEIIDSKPGMNASAASVAGDAGCQMPNIQASCYNPATYWDSSIKNAQNTLTADEQNYAFNVAQCKKLARPEACLQSADVAYKTRIQCDKQILSAYQQAKTMEAQNCRKCPDGRMSDINGYCPITCPSGQTLSADGKSCLCPDGIKADDSGKCGKLCPNGKTRQDKDGMCRCGKQNYDPNKGCCSGDEKYFATQIPIGSGKCGCAAGKVLGDDGLCARSCKCKACNKEIAEPCSKARCATTCQKELERVCMVQYGAGDNYDGCIKSSKLKGSFVGGFLHYLGKSTAPLNLDFDKIDIKKVKPSEFDAIRDALKVSREGTIEIIDAPYKKFEAPGAMSLTVGEISLRLSGMLTMKKTDCSWSFQGKLRSAPDDYDFNKGNRIWWKEWITAIGRNSKGTEYKIYILGEKAITESGLIPGCKP